MQALTDVIDYLDSVQLISKVPYVEYIVRRVGTSSSCIYINQLESLKAKSMLRCFDSPGAMNGSQRTICLKDRGKRSCSTETHLTCCFSILTSAPFLSQWPCHFHSLLCLLQEVEPIMVAPSGEREQLGAWAKGRTNSKPLLLAYCLPPSETITRAWVTSARAHVKYSTVTQIFKWNEHDGMIKFPDNTTFLLILSSFVINSYLIPKIYFYVYATH